jgi:hypothetical protein
VEEAEAEEGLEIFEEAITLAEDSVDQLSEKEEAIVTKG